MSIGIWQVLVVVVLVFLLFGAGKLPRVMEDVAKGIKGFKKGLKDDEDVGASTIEDKTSATHNQKNKE